jgi:hypothetical protein
VLVRSDSCRRCLGLVSSLGLNNVGIADAVGVFAMNILLSFSLSADAVISKN